MTLQGVRTESIGMFILTILILKPVTHTVMALLLLLLIPFSLLSRYSMLPLLSKPPIKSIHLVSVLEALSPLRELANPAIIMFLPTKEVPPPLKVED